MFFHFSLICFLSFLIFLLSVPYLFHPPLMFSLSLIILLFSVPYLPSFSSYPFLIFNHSPRLRSLSSFPSYLFLIFMYSPLYLFLIFLYSPLYPPSLCSYLLFLSFLRAWLVCQRAVRLRGAVLVILTLPITTCLHCSGIYLIFFLTP